MLRRQSAWADASAYKGSPKWTAYEEAMKTKREREAVNTNVVTRKPHYVLRGGQWMLKAAA